MFPSNWLKRIPVHSNRSRRKQGFRPRLEALEDRLAPAATRVWTGAVDTNWTTPGNWQGNAAPFSGDDLVFTGTVRTQNTNDFHAGTTFRSITFQAGQFVLSGSSIFLTQGINANVGNNLVSLPISTTGTSPTMTVAGRASLALDRTISGTGTLTKDGAGTLILSGNNTYTGS